MRFEARKESKGKKYKMIKNKKIKGQYGYRSYHRKMQIIWILLGAAIIALQLLVRNYASSTTLRTILMVSAIVSVLPVANLASPMLASWRFKTPSEAFQKKASTYENRLHMLYDLIVTSTDSIMPMDAIAVHPTGIYAYCSASKLNTVKAEKFFKEMLKSHKLDPNIKIILDEGTFFHRLDTLKPESEYEDDGSMDTTCSLLKNLSM